MNQMQKDEIEEVLRDTNLVPVIEKKIFDFLHDNYMYLPMYVHQMLIRWIMHQIHTSPLFVKTTFITNYTGNIARKSLTQGIPLLIKPEMKPKD